MTVTYTRIFDDKHYVEAEEYTKLAAQYIEIEEKQLRIENLVLKLVNTTIRDRMIAELAVTDEFINDITNIEEELGL